MTQVPETPKLNMGRLLLWGGIAILALALVIFFFVWLGGDSTENGATADQVEWSIDVSEYGPSPGEVTLKGDKPLGFPTETWKEDVRLARTVDARAFEWNMNANPAVPEPVDEINNAETCESLGDLLRDWAEQTAQAAGEARRAEAQAFAQHAADTMTAQNCEIDLAG